MTAPPLRITLQVCTGKVRHPDEFTARAAAMTVLQNKPELPHLFIYRCPECRGWHKTKRHNGSLLKVTADDPLGVLPPPPSPMPKYLSQQQYLTQGGACCPFCRATTISGGTVHLHPGVASQDVYCHECDASWTDHYRLAGYQLAP
jgi:hypothetical protein